jgi:hypothetical protein
MGDPPPKAGDAPQLAATIEFRISGAWVTCYLVPQHRADGVPIELGRVLLRWTHGHPDRMERWSHTMMEVGTELLGDYTKAPVYFSRKNDEKGHDDDTGEPPQGPNPGAGP